MLLLYGHHFSMIPSNLFLSQFFFGVKFKATTIHNRLVVVLLCLLFLISTYNFFTFVLYFCVILQRVFVQLEICENKYSSIVQGLAVKSFCWENGAFILNNCSWRQMVDIWCMYVQCASSVTNLYLYLGKIFQLPEIEIPNQKIPTAIMKLFQEILK